MLNHLKSRLTALIHDLLIIPIAWISAFWLRFNLESIPKEYLDGILISVLIITPIQLAIFYHFGLYRGIWRFASVPDFVRIVKSTVVGVALSMIALFLLNRADDIPRSVPVFYGISLIMMLGGSRLLYRWIKDHHLYLSQGQRVLIVGAGNAGEMLARDIIRNRQESYHPVAFIDDNPKRLGRDIHGIPVRGQSGQILKFVDELDIDLIMIAIPSARPADMRRIVEICESTKKPFRAIPHLPDLLSGQVSVQELREVSIEDLLGREPVTLDWQGINQKLSGRQILVTGAGGSIGSELCRQICRMNPARLIMLDSSEFNLYSIEMEISRAFPQITLGYHLGDVTDSAFIEAVFSSEKPEIVFHAAAYKHVPMLENQVRQAMRNNVLGTRQVANAADRHAAETFVLVSTDKAVNPANVMGATKRAAEIYCQNLNSQSATSFLTVRFGNVLGSAGSVIPLFKKQIQQGGPVTVTDPRMERFFMTIPEACQLIMQTTVLGNGGEIFVLDMGEPVKICYLAEQMIRLSGKTPNEDIMIEYVGLRPGEKLFEELFHEKEQLEGTGHKKVFLARHRVVDWSELTKVMTQISVACEDFNREELIYLLDLLVPERQSGASTSISTSDSASHSMQDNVIPINHKGS